MGDNARAGGGGGGKDDTMGILMRLAEALEDPNADGLPGVGGAGAGGGGGGAPPPAATYGDYGGDDGYGDAYGDYEKGQVNYDDYGDDGGVAYGAGGNTATIKRSKSAAKAAAEAEEAALAAEEAALAEAGEGVEFVARPYDAAGDEELGGVAAFGPEFARRFAPVPAGTVVPSAIPPGHAFKFYNRLTTPNWYGIAAVAVYSVALLFYLYVRMAHTLDLGRYLPYGVFVFLVEICGATTTLLYGTNLVLDPVSEVPDPEPKSDVPGMIKVKYPYHIRVLVPCYSEPLAIVAKTLEAAQAAYLPYGVRCTVYLCDDGKDPKKRRWCMAPGRDIVYVSGRTRAPGEMNGKSANLNNCMRQIYPDGRPIPPTEVVCVFDADQVANPDFFLRMLWKFDAGDDVAMVLSPQAFYNLHQRSDIFNHSNIHFWEYAQHGYDAIGFISCTGTNFLIRSAAFRDAGWSPEYTLTEDYALGMELKKRKWHCRYVEEYLVIGEAPEQVRNCFQQRSRWAKGHFQIVFSKNNPLLQKELSWGMRILYCSGVWSYFVGAVTTPLFMLIPILTIWAGTFPIVVSKWAAIGLTIYSVAQTFVLNFMRKRSHYEPIWFATIANNILWWTFVKACFNSLLSLIPGRKKITFKTTMKGSGALAMAASAIGDLWMPTLSFFALAASLGVGISKLAAGPSVVTTLSISVVWILYGMIPSFLLLWYTFIGRGSTLAFMCRVCFFLSYACSLLALMLLWAVYPAEFDYGAAAGDSLKFYAASRLGELPAAGGVAFRGPTFGYEASPKYAFPDLTGGWANGGAIGTVKLTMTTAFTTSLMAWGLLTFPRGYAKAGEAGAALDSVKWGADYLLKTVREDTGPRKGYVLAYQVGNLTLDAADWSTPENMTEAQVKRPAYVVKTSQGASDLGGAVSAALASSSLAVRAAGGDAAYADTLLTTAKGLYAAAASREGLYGARTPYVCSSKWAKGKATTAKPVASCPPPTAFANGSALAFYNSTSYRDDLLWAAAWLYKATNESSYMDDVTKWYSAHVEFEGSKDAPLVFDWDNVFLGANVLLAQITDEGAFHVTTQDMLKQWICATTNKVLFTPKGRAWNRAAPSTGATANTALLSLMYGQLASKELTTGKRDRYTCFARAQMRYILGDGGRSLMVGWGKKPPRHIQSRMAACPRAPATCDAATHLYGPAPDANVMRGAIVEFPAFDDHYADVRASNDSRVSIENNAGATVALAGLNQATGTWDQCLQGFGVLTKDHAVCEADLYVRD